MKTSLPLHFVGARMTSLENPELTALEALHESIEGQAPLQAAVNFTLRHNPKALDLCGSEAADALAVLACDALRAEALASEADGLARDWRRAG